VHPEIDAELAAAAVNQHEALVQVDGQSIVAPMYAIDPSKVELACNLDGCVLIPDDGIAENDVILEGMKAPIPDASLIDIHEGPAHEEHLLAHPEGADIAGKIHAHDGVPEQPLRVELEGSQIPEIAEPTRATREGRRSRDLADASRASMETTPIAGRTPIPLVADEEALLAQPLP